VTVLPDTPSKLTGPDVTASVGDMGVASASIKGPRAGVTGQGPLGRASIPVTRQGTTCHHDGPVNGSGRPGDQVQPSREAVLGQKMPEIAIGSMTGLRWSLCRGAAAVQCLHRYVDAEVPGLAHA